MLLAVLQNKETAKFTLTVGYLESLPESTPEGEHTGLVENKIEIIPKLSTKEKAGKDLLLLIDHHDEYAENFYILPLNEIATTDIDRLEDVMKDRKQEIHDLQNRVREVEKLVGADDNTDFDRLEDTMKDHKQEIQNLQNHFKQLEKSDLVQRKLMASTEEIQRLLTWKLTMEEKMAKICAEIELLRADLQSRTISTSSDAP